MIITNNNDQTSKTDNTYQFRIWGKGIYWSNWSYRISSDIYPNEITGKTLSVNMVDGSTTVIKN